MAADLSPPARRNLCDYPWSPTCPAESAGEFKTPVPFCAQMTILASHNRKRRGEGKPETLDFLGFTHISGKNHKTRSRPRNLDSLGLFRERVLRFWGHSLKRRSQPPDMLGFVA